MYCQQRRKKSNRKIPLKIKFRLNDNGALVDFVKALMSDYHNAKKHIYNEPFGTESTSGSKNNQGQPTD